MNTPKTLAKIGSVYIEEAILVVLEDAEGNLLPQEISERLDIPTATDGILRLANAVVLGFLTKLKLEGRVQDTDERPNVPRRWSLSDARLDSDEELLTNDNTQNGLEMIKRSALQVLYEARDEFIFITQDQVRERLGIPKVDYYDPARHNALIYGILMHLQEDGHAYHNVSVGWQITEEGVSVIEG